MIFAGCGTRLAFARRRIPGVAILSPMILATLIGMTPNNVFGTPAWAKPGVTFSLKRVLRLGIILLWQQLMASQVTQVGLAGVGVIAATLVATFAFTKWLAAPSMPWFVLGSIAMVILNSVVTIPVAPKAWIALGTTLPALHGAGRHGYRDGLPEAQGRRPEAAAAGRVGLVLHLHFALVLVKLTAYS